MSEAWIARGLLVLIIALSVLSVYMAKLFNDWNARFYNALQERNAEVFWPELRLLGRSWRRSSSRSPSIACTCASC